MNVTAPSVNEECEFNSTTSDIEHWLNVERLINLYIPPFLIIIGVLFNLCIIFVMTCSNLKTFPSSFFMFTLAVNDLMSLCVSLFAHWMHVNFPNTIIRTKYSYIMCRFFDFYGWGNCDFSIIIVALMTVDRAYAIVYPLKSLTCQTSKLTRMEVVAGAVIVVCKDFHFWFVSDIVPLGRNERLCEVPVEKLSQSYRLFYLNVWPWIHISYLSVCFVLIFVSNTIIIWKVRQSSGQLSTPSGKMDASVRIPKKVSFFRERQLRQITIMLIISSCVQLVFTFPFSIHIAIADKMSTLKCDITQKSINALIFSVTFYMLYFNKCLNFIIFSCSGSRFRSVWQKKLKQCLCFKNDLFCHGKSGSYTFHTRTSCNTSDTTYV